MGLDNKIINSGRVGVLLTLPFHKAFDYLVPKGMSIAIGDFVEVPFGNRTEIGVVWDVGTPESDGGLAEAKLKFIRHKIENYHLNTAIRKFIDWAADYNMYPKGLVLKMAMSSKDALNPLQSYTAYVPSLIELEKSGLRMTEARLKVMKCADVNEPKMLSELADEAGVSSSVVKSLADAGVLNPIEIKRKFEFDMPNPDHPGYELTINQTKAADVLTSKVAKGFSVTLLDGVTGSGKTEVYFEAVAETLRKGKQVLVLVPEISLTAQWIRRFKTRFGVKPAIWHSSLGDKIRRDTWREVCKGRVKVLVGARSGLFLPFANLGMIIVDEEHEQSYKQEEGVNYQARDMAVVRSKMEDIPLILASATPSLESLVNVEAGRYECVELHNRFAEAKLPEISAVDMTKSKPEKGEWGMSFLSPQLVKAIEKNLKNEEQTLLFLNRRGYAPLTLCRTCGHRINCPRCSAWLTDHRKEGRLVCHHCGYSIDMPEKCPECGDVDSLAPCGPGVERLAEEVHSRFPEARISIIASDTMDNPEVFAAMVKAVEEKEIDILVGTQILAKGHHFPMLTLVGVVDADLGLAGGDLRASEKTFQLMSQVAGRAGRDEREGRVLLQTYQIENGVIQALVHNDRKKFVELEKEQRKYLNMPPYGKLAALIISSSNLEALERFCYAISRIAPRSDRVQILGPAPAPLSQLRGKYRYRFLLKTPKNVKIQDVIKGWLDKIEVPSYIKLEVDVDPYSFM